MVYPRRFFPLLYCGTLLLICSKHNSLHLLILIPTSNCIIPECVCVFVCVLVAQSCPTLCNPMGCSLSGSSVHGILQTRILEWVLVPFSKGSSQPREVNLDLLHCRQILYCLSYEGSLGGIWCQYVLGRYMWLRFGKSFCRQSGCTLMAFVTWIRVSITVFPHPGLLRKADHPWPMT